MLGKHENNINSFIITGIATLNLQTDIWKVIVNWKCWRNIYCANIFWESVFIIKFLTSAGLDWSCLLLEKKQAFVSGWKMRRCSYIFDKSYHIIKLNQKFSFGLLIAVVVAGNLESKKLQSYQAMDSSFNGTICFSFGDITLIKRLD